MNRLMKVALYIIGVALFAGLVYFVGYMLPNFLTSEPTSVTTSSTTAIDTTSSTAAIDTPDPTTSTAAPVSGLSTGTIAGIVLGVLVVTLSIVFVAIQTGETPFKEMKRLFKEGKQNVDAIELAYEMARAKDNPTTASFETFTKKLSEKARIRAEQEKQIIDALSLKNVRKMIRGDIIGYHHPDVLRWYYRKTMGMEPGERINLEPVRGEFRL